MKFDIFKLERTIKNFIGVLFALLLIGYLRINEIKSSTDNFLTYIFLIVFIILTIIDMRFFKKKFPVFEKFFYYKNNRIEKFGIGIRIFLIFICLIGMFLLLDIKYLVHGYDVFNKQKFITFRYLVVKLLLLFYLILVNVIGIIFEKYRYYEK